MFDVMNDDLNSPKLIANLFEAVKWINEIDSSKLKINAGRSQVIAGNLQNVLQ